jgi:hypothetical protein
MHHLCALQMFLQFRLTLCTLYANMLLVRFEEFAGNCCGTKNIIALWTYRMYYMDNLRSCRGVARISTHVLAKAVGHEFGGE